MKQTRAGETLLSMKLTAENHSELQAAENLIGGKHDG